MTTRCSTPFRRPGRVWSAHVGGIGAHERYPATYWRENLLMGIHVLEAARRAGVARVIVVGAPSAYPKHAALPFRESSLWDGIPEDGSAAYGVAKRALLTGLEAYRREFGLSGSYVIPANLYGPGDADHVELGHVIPAMIRAFEDARIAGQEEVVLWGTGSATREFLFVEDCADALVRLAAHPTHTGSINLGTGREISIAELALAVRHATGYKGSIRWDACRPEGQPRRVLSSEQAARALGWRPSTTLEEGLARTVAWYRAECVAPVGRVM